MSTQRVGATRAGASVVPLLRTLRWCGFCRLTPASPGEDKASLAVRVKRATHDAYCGFALAVTTTYLVQEVIYAYQERSDLDKLARVLFLLLCHVTSIAKQVVFMTRASRVAELVKGLDDAMYNPNEPSRASLLMQRAHGASRLGTVYAGTAALTCALWTIFPFLVRFGGTQVTFALWIPFAYYSWPEFLIVLMYTHYVTSLVGIANTTMDAFIATVLGQCKTQLTILKMDFESLAERAHERANETGERLGAAATTLLVRCIKHHHRICHTSRELQSVFGSAVLLQFGIGGWILCMAAYKLVGLSVASLEFVSMLMFLMCILTELFLYCYYGNEVAVESTQVSDAVYSMQWVGPDGVGRDVQLALPLVLCCCAGAARRPLRPAAFFIPLSLETFITCTVCSGSAQTKSGGTSNALPLVRCCCAGAVRRRRPPASSPRGVVHPFSLETFITTIPECISERCNVRSRRSREGRLSLPLVLCCCTNAVPCPPCLAALFIPLFLKASVTILRSSYAIYAMLRQTQV